MTKQRLVSCDGPDHGQALPPAAGEPMISSPRRRARRPSTASAGFGSMVLRRRNPPMLPRPRWPAANCLRSRPAWCARGVVLPQVP